MTGGQVTGVTAAGWDRVVAAPWYWRLLQLAGCPLPAGIFSPNQVIENRARLELGLPLVRRGRWVRP